MAATETYLRVLTVEIHELSKDKDEHWRQFNELRDIMVQVQELTNFFFDMWRAWHFTHNSAAKIRQFQQAWKEYREFGDGIPKEKKWVSRRAKQGEHVMQVKGVTKKDKPKLDLFPVDGGLVKGIYAEAVRQWPRLHTRVVTLAINRLVQLVKSGKSAVGAWPKWHSQLLFREAIPTFTKPCPICFDDHNCKIEPPPPGERKESFKLHVSFAREDVGKKNKQSVTYRCVVRDQGKKMVGRKQTLAKISSGEYDFAGSQLFLKDNKLFAAVAYKMQKPDRVVGTGVAILRPSRTSPLKMRAGGREVRIGGDGRIVGVIRKQLMAQRWSRQESYRRCSTSARKGHGFKRAMQKVVSLSNRWRDFVKTANRNYAVEACKRAVFSGCGVLLFVRPDKDSRFLSQAGRFDGRDLSSWDWFGMEKILADKCVEFGLEFVSKESKSIQRCRDNKIRKDQLDVAAV